jgi:DNA repair and recombination protein RAD52
MPDKASAFQKVKKEAATDSLKRALRNFGNVLGNCIYDRDYLTQVTRIKAGTRRWDPDNFHRHSSYGPIRTENASRESLDKTSKDQGSRPDRPEDDEYGGDAFEDMDFINPDEVCLGTELSPVKKVLGRFEPTRSDRSSTPISEAGPPEQGQGNKAPSRLQSHEQSVPNIPSNQMQRQQPPHLQPQSNLQPTPPRTGPEIRSLAVTSPVRSGAQNNYTIPEPRQQNTLPPANGNISPVQNQGNQTRTNNTSHPSNESEGGAPNSETPIGWFSSKALLNAPASEASTLANITLNPFNPHKPWHGSKTQGVNHNKSAPVKRQIVSQSPQISNNNVQNNRPNFVSPQVDSNRKIGMPAGATPNSLTNRTSYKPPGPAAVKRNADTMTRSVLSDVSNVQNSVQVDAHDSKRQRVEANTKATVDSGTTLGSVGDSENKDKS